MAGITRECKVFSRARHGRTEEMLREMERVGMPVDSPDEHGNTLLLVAAQNGHKSAVRKLLRRGADINAQNKKGANALWFAESYGYADVAAYLRKKGAAPCGVPVRIT